MNLHVDLDTAVLLILNLIGWGALFLTILYDRRHDRLSRSSELQSRT